MKKKRKSLKTNVDKKNKNTKYKTVRKASVDDVLLKAEALCVGQMFKKLSAVLGITEDEVQKLIAPLEGTSMDTRMSKTDFETLKPILKMHIQEILEPLPATAKVKLKKRKSNTNLKATNYSKLKGYKGYVRFVSSNM